MSIHINGYALALFDLAQEEKKLEEYKKQASLIILALEETNEYISLLNNKSVETEVRQELVQKAFARKINKNLMNFMKVLVERSKAQIAVPALKKLIKFINVSLKVSEGVVYSTTKLTPAVIKNIEKKTSLLLKKNITLENKLDKELVSGIRVIVGDEVIEDSILSRLEQIKKELLEREAN